MHGLDLIDAEALPLDGEVDRLTTGHPEASTRLGEQIDQPQSYGRRCGQRWIAREQLERQRLQRIPDQQGRRLVERLVAGRPAPTQVVVVHGRQVVVHERVNMDEFYGARCRFNLVLGESHGASRRENERRTYALAATEHAVAHGFVQPGRNSARVRKPSGESLLDAQLPGLDLRAKWLGRPGVFGRRSAAVYSFVHGRSRAAGRRLSQDPPRGAGLRTCVGRASSA
jgi:hypothetical protein